MNIRFDPKIAIIEDEPAVAHLLERIIRANFPQVPVVAFDDPFEALPVIEEQRYNIVITDIHLPNLHGDDLIRRLNELKQGIQTIVLTGDETMVIALTCFRLGARFFINKPLNKEKLFIAIRNCMESLCCWAEKIP